MAQGLPFTCLLKRSTNPHGRMGVVSVGGGCLGTGTTTDKQCRHNFNFSHVPRGGEDRRACELLSAKGLVVTRRAWTEETQVGQQDSGCRRGVYCCGLSLSVVLCFSMQQCFGAAYE